MHAGVRAHTNAVDPKTINSMLEARLVELVNRRVSGSKEEQGERRHETRKLLEKCLGLYPHPPKTDLKARITGTIERQGYRIEKLRYESRPGVLVTAHLYLPSAGGQSPLVLHPHGHWAYKKSTPWVQARAIGLAHLGMASLVIDSPGFTDEPDEFNERKAMGSHNDPFLVMGAPVTGQYVWDIVRGLDYCEKRPDIDASRVGITGESGGGLAAMYAFAFDIRIKAAVPVCYASSLASRANNGCLCNHVPGVAELGDRADILGLRAPDPIMLIGASDDPEFPPEGMRKTYDKLRQLYRHYRAEDKLRLEIIEAKHDYNRRMREAMYAFFCQHLKGDPAFGHIPEPRPLTDGAFNPFEAGTEPMTSQELLVTGWQDRTTLTFRDLLTRALNEPYPEAMNEPDRLVPWGRHARFPEIQPGPTLRLLETAPAHPDKTAVVLPVNEVDQRLCFYLGLSVPEVLAQVIHLLMPGRPDGWEANAVGVGDALSSMIASVKTLVTHANPVELPTAVIADGPVASQTAYFLKLLRPDLAVQASHRWESWTDIVEAGVPALAQPQARYLAWPFAGDRPSATLDLHAPHPDQTSDE